MVLFKCKTCAASIMHRDVDKHVGKCSGPLALKCVDCSNDFFGQQYEMHTRCSAPRAGEFPKVPESIEFNKVPQRAGEYSKVPQRAGEFSKVPETTKKMSNGTKKPKIPKKKPGKGAKKGVNGTAATTRDPKVLQEQWKQAGFLVSQDPSLTAQQKFLLVNTCKHQAPQWISNRTVKKALICSNKKAMNSFCIAELVREVLQMIELEFKNINGSLNKDASTLTSNQQLIGSILSASEAPGLNPHQKSLLASLEEDEAKKTRLLQDYTRITWGISQHRVEFLASQAFKKFEAEFLKMQGIDPADILQEKNKKQKKVDKSTEGSANRSEEKQHINGEKDVETKVERKQERRKKQMDGETLENEIGGVQKISDLAIDNSSKQSKKRKHKGEGQNDELLAESPTNAEEDTPTKKSKKEKKRKQEKVTDAEIGNGCAEDVSEHVVSKKIKKHKKRREGEEEVPSEVKEDDDNAGTPLDVPHQKNKKKKHKCEEEAKEFKKHKKDKKRSKAVEAEI